VQTGSRFVDFQAISPETLPGTGVAEIPGGIVMGLNGWILSPEKQLLVDQSAFSLAPKYWPKERDWHEVVRLPGRCLTLTAEWAWHNYAHFLLEGVTRLEVFQRSGLGLEDIDHIYCACPSREMRKLVYHLGLPEGKCIWAQDGLAYQTDTLIFANFPSTYRCPSHRSVDFLRRSFQPPLPNPQRRIYIQREKNRKIENEAELLPLLKANDFEIYRYDGSATNQIRAFAESNLVVGIHGADMANLTFCSPGSKVLEIVSTDFYSPFFYNLAEAAGLKHYHLVGTALQHRGPEATGAGQADLRVDATEFEEALKTICQS
jgi:capsular polysaccharide biosynthesis protein